MRTYFPILGLIMTIIIGFLGTTTSTVAAPKKFTEAEKGRFRTEFRAENPKVRQAKQVIGACVRRKMGRE